MVTSKFLIAKVSPFLFSACRMVCLATYLLSVGSLSAEEKIVSRFDLILDETGPRGVPEESYQTIEIFPSASVEAKDGVLKFPGVEGNQFLLKGVEELFPEGASWTLLVKGKANLVDRVMIPVSLANSNEASDRILEVQIRRNCESLFAGTGGGAELEHLLGVTVNMDGNGEFVVTFSYDAEAKTMTILANNEIKTMEVPSLKTPAPDEPLRLGAFRSGFGAFQGEISILRIFNRALTEEELLQIANNEASK